jgi:hypothetical protein
MKLRIIESGWETYTGLLGDVEFVNGVSVEEVTNLQSIRLGASIRIESLDGAPQGMGQHLLNTNGNPAEVLEPLQRGVDSDAKVEERPATSTNVRVYTRAELEKLADSGGISALRAVGDEMKVRGRSISDLIEGILKTQTANTAASLTSAE